MPDGFACRTFDTSPKKRTEYACMAENAVVVKHELDGTYTNVEVAREQLHTMVNIDGHGGGFFHIIPEGRYYNDKVQICSRCAFGFSKCLVINPNNDSDQYHMMQGWTIMTRKKVTRRTWI